MKFVEYTQVIRCIPQTFRQRVAVNDVFQALEEAAAIIIRDTAGIAFPVTLTDTPDWVVLPAGWIIAHLAVPEFTSVDEATLKYIDANFKRAIETLLEKSAEIAATPSTDGTTGKYSKITQKGTWQ